MNNPYLYLSKKEQRQVEKTIKAGINAKRRLKNYSKEINAKRNSNLILLKKLRRGKTTYE